MAQNGSPRYIQIKEGTTTIQITENTTVSRIENIVASEIDGETVMMSIELGNYYGPDLIASRIWALMEKPILVPAMIDQLLTEYPPVNVVWTTWIN